MLTYKDLQDRVLRWIDEVGDTSTTLALVKDAINASHRRLLTGRQWPFMKWPRTETFTTVENVSTYALHPEANRVKWIWNVTSRQYLPVMPTRALPAVGADKSSTDVVPYGVELGPTWPVKVQPSTAGVVTIVSSSASDTTQTVVVLGMDGSGDLQVETISVNGTTPVSGVIAFSVIKNLTKTGTWVGTMSLSVGGTVLETLPAATSGRRYPTVEFLEAPLGGRVFTYAHQRTPITLVYDEDIPETPFPDSEIHVYDALLDLTTYNTELGQKEQVQWQKRYDEHFSNLVTAWDEEIVGAYPRQVRDLDDITGAWSRVGVYNP